MSERTMTPDFSTLEVPWDMWSEPFWKAAAEHRVIMPRCTHCATFHWPASPFCFVCQSQQFEWAPAGQARLYSYTVLPVPGEDKTAPPTHRAPAVVEFDEAKGVRLVSVLIDAPLDAIAIGEPIDIDWLPAANATVPVFRLKSK